MTLKSLAVLALKIPILADLIDLFRPANLRPTLILLVSVVVMVAWKTLGSQDFYLDHLTELLPLGDPSASAAYYQMAMTLVLLGVLPACLMRLVFGQSLASLGLGRGSITAGLVLLTLTLPFILWVSLANADDAVFRAMYPLNRGAGHSASTFVMHPASLGLFYLGWEFHFRGFLQRGLGASIGPSAAICLQVLASSLLHLDRPGAELWASIPAALLWGLQAKYTGAIWTGVVQHWLLGATLDYFICFG